MGLLQIVPNDLTRRAAVQNLLSPAGALWLHSGANRGGWQRLQPWGLPVTAVRPILRLAGKPRSPPPRAAVRT